MGKEYGSYLVSDWARSFDKAILERNQKEIDKTMQVIKNLQENVDVLRKQSREILHRD